MQKVKSISFLARWRITAALVSLALIVLAVIILQTSHLAGRALTDVSLIVSQAKDLNPPTLADFIDSRGTRVVTALQTFRVLTILLFAILIGSVLILMISLRAAARKTAVIATARNRLNAIVSASMDGILVCDQQGCIQTMNETARHMFGIDDFDAGGANVAYLIHPNSPEEPDFLECLKHGPLNHGRCHMTLKGIKGGKVPVELSWSAVLDAGHLFVVFLRDISEQIAAQNALEKARDLALAGEKAKANLLAVMSHEMRTPLNGLLGSLQLLSRTQLRQRQRRFVSLMQSSGQILLDQVNNVLDLSRMDAGKLAVDPHPFTLKTLVSDVVTGLRAQAKLRGNKISFRMIGKPPKSVLGDRGRISQILVNLIGNAIKFTENGQIRVDVERDPRGDMIEFRISDTGIGISKADQNRIFDDFVTLDSSFGRAVEGTGLGLGIVKRLTDLMNGSLALESAPQQGTVVRVRLPLPQATVSDEIDDPMTTDTTDVSNVSILVAEDNEVNRLIVREMLTCLGAQITEAVNGEEALARADERRFDLIFCDISMPKLDGLQVSQRIRANGGPNAETPIIAVTAHGLPTHADRFAAAGMSDVIVKPLTFEELERVLQKFTPSTLSLNTNHRHPDLNGALGGELSSDIQSRARTELQDGLSEIAALSSKKNNLQTVAECAHKLAGLAAVLGYQSLHACLTSIEDAARARSRKAVVNLIPKASALLGAQG